jgi:hypothetical protein
LAHTYWQIVATERYIEQVSRLPLGKQDRIQKQWLKLSQEDDPLTMGNTATCRREKDPTFVAVIFPGIACEFMYEIVARDRELWLMNCKVLSFLEYNNQD